MLVSVVRSYLSIVSWLSSGRPAQFLLSSLKKRCSIEFPNERLTFYTRAGKEIFDSGPGHPVEVTDDRHSITLCRVVPMRDMTGSMYVEDARVFLPLVELVTKQLDNQVIWFLQLSAKQVKAGPGINTSVDP